jgi:hypothetical protein
MTGDPLPTGPVQEFDVGIAQIWRYRDAVGVSAGYDKIIAAVLQKGPEAGEG